MTRHKKRHRLEKNKERLWRYLDMKTAYDCYVLYKETGRHCDQCEAFKEWREANLKEAGDGQD